MKRILLIWCLTVAPCLAGPLISFEALSSQYGPPVGRATYESVDPATRQQLMDTKFQSNGLDILVVSDMQTNAVVRVEISRDASFNSMEIPDILKPLSSFEDWKQKDDKTWVLTKGKITAQWDGEGKISIGSD